MPAEVQGNSRRITIIRHVNADSPKGVRDHDRPPSLLGRSQAQSMAESWSLPLATRVASSPAVRCVALANAIALMSKTLVIEVPQLYIPVGEEPGAQEMKEMYKDLGSNAPLSAYRAHKHGEWISKHTEAALGSIALPFMLEKHLVVVMHGTYGPALALKILGEEDPVSEELRERIFDEAEGVTIEFEWTGDFEATFIRNSEES